MRYWLLYALKDLSLKGQHRFALLIILLSLIGVALAVALTLVILSVANGLKTELTQLLVKMTPHITVRHARNEILYDYEGIVKQIEKIPDVEKVYPFLSTEVLISGPGGVEGAILQAVPETADVPHRVSALRSGIILGENLADALGVQTGEEVTLTAPTGQRGEFSVTGIFSSGLYQYDRGVSYMLLSRAQEFISAGTGISGLLCKVKEPLRAWSIARTIGQLLPPTYRTDSWDQVNRNVLLALSLQKRALLIVLFFVILIAELVIVSSMTMRISGKAKEIGILNALGVTKRGIMFIFITEGISIAAIGVGSGCILAILLSIAIRMLPLGLPPGSYGLRYLPVTMAVGDFVLVSILTLGASFLASLYPAQKAAKLSAAEALRYG